MTDISRSIYRRWPTKASRQRDRNWRRGLADIIDAEGLDAQVLALVRQVLHRSRRADIGAAAVGVIAAIPYCHLINDGAAVCD